MSRSIRRVVSSRLKVAELRDICTGMGLLSTGPKRDLLARINDLNLESEIEHNETNTIQENNRQALLDEQEREFQEGLRQDKINTVEKSITNGSYMMLSVSDIKLYLDSKNIDYTNVVEKDEFVKLILPDEVQEDDNQEMDTEDKDTPLSLEELRQARMRFYQ